MNPFDIIVPVYGAFHDARAAMESVLSSTNLADFRLIVIDDASPDDFAAFIGELADHPKVEIFRNPENLGFSATVNRGIAMHPDRDVVLLNSDAIVYGDWLDRLSRILRDNATVGTITPMSNAATILSYPHDCVDYADRLETDWWEIDEICARIDADPVDIPTAIGFCMAIRRACLDEIGPFDAARFGRGYGEENDFCMRALAHGWTNVAACNVFAWHRGASSFKGERERLAARAQDLLRELHPHYPGLVGDFLRRNPLAPLRAEIDAQRARKSGSGVLIVGDAEAADDRPALRLRREGRKRWRFAFATGAPLPNLRPFEADEPLASLRQQLLRLDVSRLRIARNATAPRALRDAALSLDLPIETI
ncbi:MAG TPA: glycosyltransferase family 2 protein [Rhodoblastus sp.]|nr:glycosyltransferase family 2 protein [Rhodoblastus sp.]